MKMLIMLTDITAKDIYSLPWMRVIRWRSQIESDKPKNDFHVWSPNVFAIVQGWPLD